MMIIHPKRRDKRLFSFIEGKVINKKAKEDDKNAKVHQEVVKRVRLVKTLQKMRQTRE